jgi:hypothetical protein
VQVLQEHEGPRNAAAAPARHATLARGIRAPLERRSDRRASPAPPATRMREAQ